MVTSLPPSGRQVELLNGDQRATVVEVGAGLRTYEVGGVAVLDGYPENRMCNGGRGQLLLPWPNRIRDGRYEVRREPQQLALTEPELHHAIHGLARWLPWRLEQPDAAAVTGRCELPPQPGYPFRLDCRVTYRLGPGGLEVEVALTNRSPRSAPAGMGAHPYLAPGDGLVDGARLAIPAARRLVTDERSIPVGSAEVAGGPYDFRKPRQIADTVLDTAYTELTRDADGWVRVELARADGLTLTLSADHAWNFLQVYTGETLPEPERRRGLAVEPMTCPPNAFNSGEGLRMLEPGETFAGVWRIGVSGTRSSGTGQDGS